MSEENEKARGLRPEAEGALAQASSLKPQASLRLDLGSGSRPREGFTGVDIAHLPSITRFDLTSGAKWPWLDGSVDELSSSHFIEHIAADYVEVVRSHEPQASGLEPRAQVLVEHVLQDRLLFFFDEAYRVIKPGGLFHLAWPALQHTDAFRDPTHRRFIPLETLYYLSRESREQMGLQHYEVLCNWVVIPESVRLEGEPSVVDMWQEFNNGTDNRLNVGGTIELTDHRHFWNVARAWSVTLRAEIP